MLVWLWRGVTTVTSIAVATYFVRAALSFVASVQGTMVDRKLQGVYDCIDMRNFKGAVKLCQKKELKDLDIAKSLMAYCYLSMERTDEGLAIARDVKDRKPIDDQVLRTLTHCFRISNRVVDIAECYEAAVSRVPEREEFAVELFRAHARCGDAKKMQADALKLYKMHNNPKYVFWAVSCMLQQEVTAMSCMLAERMLRKVLFETHAVKLPKRTAGGEEALLWAGVLLRQAEKADCPLARLTRLHEALQSLQDFGAPAERSEDHSMVPMHNPVELKYRIDSDVQFMRDPSIIELHPFVGKTRQLQVVQTILASSCFPEDGAVAADGSAAAAGGEGAPYGTRAEYVVQLESLFEGILFNYPDQWDVHEQWIQHVLTLGAEAVLAHRERLLEMHRTFPKLRGPYLAEMLLFTQAYLAADTDTCAGWAPTALSGATEGLVGLAPLSAHAEVSRLLCRYITLFEHKDCCFTDVQRYLESAFGGAGAGACRGVVVQWLLQRRGEAGRAAWTNLADTDSDAAARREVLCRLNKLDQIVHALSPSAEHTPRTLLLDRLGMHATASAAPSTLAVAGAETGKEAGAALEDRGMRAADNILLICSSWIQDALAGCVDGGSGPDPVPPEVRYFFGHALWATVLTAGKLCSGQNYVFPLQAQQGPLRALALSQAGLTAYMTLDVKQIQVRN
jgi:hypothetical protein